MSDDRMPKIKQGDIIKSTQLNFMKIIEQENIRRAAKLQRMSKKNAITGSLLMGGVLSIYAYSIWAVKQEDFLDDFKIPETEHK